MGLLVQNKRKHEKNLAGGIPHVLLYAQARDPLRGLPYRYPNDSRACDERVGEGSINNITPTSSWMASLLLHCPSCRKTRARIPANLETLSPQHEQHSRVAVVVSAKPALMPFQKPAGVIACAEPGEPDSNNRYQHHSDISG